MWNGINAKSMYLRGIVRGPYKGAAGGVSVLCIYIFVDDSDIFRSFEDDSQPEDIVLTHIETSWHIEDVGREQIFSEECSPWHAYGALSSHGKMAESLYVNISFSIDGISITKDDVGIVSSLLCQQAECMLWYSVVSIYEAAPVSLCLIIYSYW